jgi:hypothetical protein
VYLGHSKSKVLTTSKTEKGDKPKLPRNETLSVISQGNGTIVFFSRKLTAMLQHYSVTKI